MEQNEQPRIMGYRQLSEKEAELVNEGKALAVAVGAYVAKLQKHAPSTHPSATGELPPLNQRWISIGATHLQEGFMALTRGIAQPTTF